MKLQIHNYHSGQVTTAFKIYNHTYVTESLIPYTYLGIILKVNTRNWTQKVPTIYSSLKLLKKKITIITFNPAYNSFMNLAPPLFLNKNIISDTAGRLDLFNFYSFVHWLFHRLKC